MNEAKMPRVRRGTGLRFQLQEYEVSLIIEALRASEGNQIDAAKRLGIPLRTLVYKIRKFSIHRRLAEDPTRELAG